MAIQEWQTYCPRCQTFVLGRRETPNHILHFLITFFTCGLWIIPWIVISIAAGWEPFRCPTCGTAGVNAPREKPPVSSKPLDQQSFSRQNNRVALIIVTVIVIVTALAFVVNVGRHTNPTAAGGPSESPTLRTSAESATPEIRKAVPVLSSSPLAAQKKASDTAKPSTFPLSRIIAQPESTVNKVLGNPQKHRLLNEDPSKFSSAARNGDATLYYAGGTYVAYPDGPTWKVLAAVFYHDKLTYVTFYFEPYAATEADFFAALGLPKESFTVTKRLEGLTTAIQYRGMINKQLIEIVAWHPNEPSLRYHKPPLRDAFCDHVTVELVDVKRPGSNR